MSSPSLGLEEAKAYLQKSTGDSNLYDHLSELLLKILVEKPDNALEAFEDLSAKMKVGRYAPSNDTNDSDPVSKMELSVKSQQEAWSSHATALAQVHPETELTTEDLSSVEIADICDEATMWEWAGLGFGRGETFRLSLALAQLARTTEGLTSLRLWGKILGRGGDFVIAEGEMTVGYEPTDESAEEGSAGVNQKTYWCLPEDGTYVWTKLPHVTRAQILAARKLKRFIGSDLDAPIPGNPPFPGTERHFLRAQIARITSSTVICPSGLYSPSEDGLDVERNNLDDDDSSPSRTASELADIGTWVHLSKEINAVYGRCTAMPENDAENTDTDASWAGQEIVPVLRSLAEDSPGSWKVSVAPVTPVSKSGQVAVVKSLVWPGAVSVAVGKKFLNFYSGTAVKTSSVRFQPTLPADVQLGFGLETTIEAEEGGSSGESLVFTNVMEQPDVVEDPTPATEEVEEE